MVVAGKKIKIASNFIPRKNLPKKFSSKKYEENFVDKFISSYVPKIKSSSLFVRELAMPSLGIADFVQLSNLSTNKDGALRAKTIIAFEMKINNWKKALFQSFKYFYFADKVVVILPKKNSKKAIENLYLFKKLNVALWLLDEKVCTIEKVFNPRKNTALIKKERERAINKVIRFSN